MPKSVSLTSPDHDSSTLRGVTSRWTMPSARAVGALAAVRVVERLAALGGDERREQRRQRLAGRARQARAEVLALDALHGEEHLVVDPAEVEHRDDVLVREAHRQPRFAHEQVEEPRVVRALGPHPLHHEPLLDARGPPAREVHLAHAAARERPEQLVATQRTAHDG